MILQLLKWTLLVALVPVVLGLLKDLACYINYRRLYAGQGIHFNYIPIVGIIYYVLGPLHAFFENNETLKKYKHRFYTSSDSGAKHVQFYESRKGEDIVAVNHVDQRPYLLITNLDLINEYMLKDNDMNIRILPMELPLGLGFFTKNGARGLHERAVFSQFFHFSKLEELTPKMVTILQSCFDQFEVDFPQMEDQFPPNFKFQDANRAKKDGYKSVDMREFLLEAVSKIVNQVLFGYKEMATIDGLSVPIAIERLYDLTTKSLFEHPLNALSGGLLGKYKLIEPVRKAWDLAEKLKKVLKEEYEKRCLSCTETNARDASNILDLFVIHNKQARDADKLSIEEITQGIAALKLASVDTSRSVTESMMNLFVNDDKNYDWFKKNILTKFDQTTLLKYATYQSSPILEAYTKEMIRLLPPGVIMFDRLTTKDFTLGKYKIYKGTKVSYSVGAVLHSEQYYKDPFTLNPDRFMESAENIAAAKKAYIPFSIGKRNCIGRNLGELMVQMLLLHVGLRLDLKPVEGMEYGAVQALALGPQNCFIRVKPVSKLFK